MPRIYSHTVLESFAECPHQGQQTMDSQRYQKAGPSRQGQAGHAVAEALMKHLVKEGRTSDAEYGEKLVTRALSNLSEEDAAGIEGDLMNFVQNDFHWCPDATDNRFEERLFFDVASGRPIPAERVSTISAPVFAMTADWSFIVDGILHVLDWKFGRVPQHLKEPRKNRQLRRYTAAVYRTAPQVKGAFGMVYHGRYGYWEEGHFEEHELEPIWEQEVVQPVMRRERDQQTHAPSLVYCVGIHCKDCDVRNSCAAFLAERPLVADAPIEQVATEYSIAKQRVKDLEVLLRGHFDDDGPTIEGQSHTLKLGVSASPVLDPVKVRAKLDEYLTPEQVQVAFTVSKTSAEKALTKAKMKPKDRLPVMEAILADRTGTKVSSSIRIARKRYEREVEDAE